MNTEELYTNSSRNGLKQNSSKVLKSSQNNPFDQSEESKEEVE